MSTWKQTKRRRAKKALEKKQEERRRTEQIARAAADEAFDRWVKTREEAVLAAAHQAREQGADVTEQVAAGRTAADKHREANPLPPRRTPRWQSRFLLSSALLLGLGSCGMKPEGES